MNNNIPVLVSGDIKKLPLRIITDLRLDINVQDQIPVLRKKTVHTDLKLDVTNKADFRSDLKLLF